MRPAPENCAGLIYLDGLARSPPCPLPLAPHPSQSTRRASGLAPADPLRRRRLRPQAGGGSYPEISVDRTGFSRQIPNDLSPLR